MRRAHFKMGLERETGERESPFSSQAPVKVYFNQPTVGK